MFQPTDASALASGPHPLTQRINENQAVLEFPDDDRRLLEQDPPASSSYGAVAAAAAGGEGLEDGRREGGRQHPAALNLGWGARLYLCVLLVVGMSGLVALSGVFRNTPGSVSLETDAAFPFTTTTKHLLRPGPLWGAVTGPYPTGAWWLNLAIGEGDFPVAPLPYTIKSSDAGVGVSYSAMRRVESLERVADAYAADLSVSAKEGVTGRHIVKYDNLTVTLQHDAANEGNFRTLLARGSPYMTFEFAGATPRIKTNGDILEINGKEAEVGASLFATTFKLALSNWETWVVFTSESVTWKVTSLQEVEMKAPFSGIVRVAVLPHPWDSEGEMTLSEHAYAYPRGGRVAFDVDGDGMEMRYEWDKDGFGDLLMMALPHHMDTMDAGADIAIVMADSYQCIKGPMTGIVGSVWTMRDNLTDIAWTARTPLQEAALSIDDPLLSLSWERRMHDALAADVNSVLPSAPDVYSFGKEISRMARLALVADELGDIPAREAALATMGVYLTPWMKNDNEDLLVYDKTWGGIVTKDGLNNQNADYGNAWYNDHTYHYGYLLYAAAVLTKFRPVFHRTYKKQLDFLVADVATMGGGRMAKYFPTARQKDFYDGHSWTSGIFPQGNGKSQESVSESINAYYGVYLLGLATGDDATKDWGRVLLAMEVRAARKYWQMPRHNGVYDSYFSSHRMVGMVASLEAVQLTWFGDNVEYVHCINMMPFTPITEDLLHRDYMEQEWPVLEAAFDGREPDPQWAGFIYLAASVVLPVEAWANLTALDIFDNGNSKTNSLYWIATRPSGAEAYNESMFPVEVKVEAECSANSACQARGLTQGKLCCPTKDDGWLGCCPSGDGVPEGPSACSSNPNCVAAGLATGLCCPGHSGEMLACCGQGGDDSEDDKKEHKAEVAVDPQALCSANQGCATLEGACCPTQQGVYLGCCGSVHVSGRKHSNSSAPSPTPTKTSSSKPTGGEVKVDGGVDDDDEEEEEEGPGDDRDCANHPGCSALQGACCPSPDGTMLSCCSDRL
ncbi:unnamed protein product [Ectocarpus sp. 4 AP-2014]